MKLPRGEAPLVWRTDGPASRDDIVRRAARVASRMPERRFLINLCESRDAFLTAFLAARIARQTQLMPGARTPAAIADLAKIYPDCHAIRDEDIARLAGGAAAAETSPAEFAAGQAVLIAFTSGSTGDARAHEKHPPALEASARLNGAAIRAELGLGPDVNVSIVGTVPAHHMYGVEFTALLPLLGGMSVHVDRPLFPADVAAAIASIGAPRVLVSTPVHLRALAESDVSFPALDLIVSATAPLDAGLARRIESRLGAPLLEMFGSTETCVIATRRTARDTQWQLYEGIDVDARDDSTRVTAPWFLRDQDLQDVLETDGRRFSLRGRNADLVDVAGKRASLADITRRLCAVPGVTDAVAFQPDSIAGVVNRVAALVVSRGATERQIADELAASLDAVFLPRPLLFVERIPRDAVGKVSRSRLLELLAAHGGR